MKWVFEPFFGSSSKDHFKNKNLLVRDIVMRRAEDLNLERMRVLENYRRAIGDQKPDVSAVLRAFLDPFFDKRMGGDQGWKNYSAFIGRIVWDPAASSHINEAFNAVAREYIEALKAALPGVSEERIQWGFQFLLASMYSAEESNTRIAGLSHNRFSGKELETAYKTLLPFLTAGFLELQGQERKPSVSIGRESGL